jgi:hypothetical protein
MASPTPRGRRCPRTLLLIAANAGDAAIAGAHPAAPDSKSFIGAIVRQGGVPCPRNADDDDDPEAALQAMAGRTKEVPLEREWNWI